jgi:hypothetical protein
VGRFGIGMKEGALKSNVEENSEENIAENGISVSI